MFIFSDWKSSSLKNIIKIHYYKQSVKTRFFPSTSPLPLQCNARFLGPEIERDGARRDVRRRVLDFRSISIRARRIARYWRRKKYRTSFRLAVSVQRPALKRPVPEAAARVRSRARARAMHNTDSFHVATSGGARLPGLPGITGELSPIDKKSQCFPFEQRHGMSERYIHKCRCDPLHCLHIRDLRYFAVLSL